MKESVVSSKREGGEWAITVVPIEYVDLVNKCLAKYNGEVDSLQVNEQMLLEFANYMLHEIERNNVT